MCVSLGAVFYLFIYLFNVRLEGRADFFRGDLRPVNARKKCMLLQLLHPGLSTTETTGWILFQQTVDKVFGRVTDFVGQAAIYIPVYIIFILFIMFGGGATVYVCIRWREHTHTHTHSLSLPLEQLYFIFICFSFFFNSLPPPLLIERGQKKKKKANTTKGGGREGGK